MNWDDVRIFLALAECGSLSAAARRLAIDHTTVARRVSALEAAIGVRLMDRLPRAVVLTEAGAAFAERAQGMRAAAFAMQRAARGMDDAMAGPVRVSAPPLFARRVVAPHLGELRRRHPGIVLDLIGDVAFADLDRSEADLAVRLSRPEGLGLVARRIGGFGFALSAAPVWAARDPSEWRFVAHDRSALERPQDLWLDGFLGGRPVVFRSNDDAILAAAAQAGVGVALLPAYLALPGLVDLPADRPLPRREVWLAVHDDVRRAPRVRAVIEFLAEVTDGVSSSSAGAPSPARPGAPGSGRR